MTTVTALGDATNATPIRVFVVGAEGVVRDGMRLDLDALDDVALVGEAADRQGALTRLSRLACVDRLPDVVLLDLHLPDLDGLTVLSAITACFPANKLIILTASNDAETVRAAAQLGVAGYLLKDAPAAEVAAAIRAVDRGQAHLDCAAAACLLEALHDPPRQRPLERLTRRQRDVLALVAQGLTTRAIAARLDLSERTVRTHVSHILHTLGLRSRLQAALYALKAAGANEPAGVPAGGLPWLPVEVRPGVDRRPRPTPWRRSA